MTEGSNGFATLVNCKIDIARQRFDQHKASYKVVCDTLNGKNGHHYNRVTTLIRADRLSSDIRWLKRNIEVTEFEQMRCGQFGDYYRGRS